MKKNMLFLFIAIYVFVSSLSVYALSSEKKEKVTLSNCVDSVSARFMQNNNEIKVKFIGIDTVNALNASNNNVIDESVISDFVCEKLKSATKIELELEENADVKDKYDRYNAWVFIDDVMLQDILLQKGYVKTYYLYENYKYYEQLKESENAAKTSKLGIWDLKEEETNVVEDKEEKEDGLFDMLLNFINKVFEKILKFVDDLIKNVFK